MQEPMKRDKSLLEQIKGGWMDLEPNSRDYLEGNEPVSTFKLVTVFGRDALKQLSVIAWGYEKKKYGRVRREWNKQFTDAEKATVSRWYLRIYAWEFRTGHPENGVRMNLTTYETLLKAANFFGDI